MYNINLDRTVHVTLRGAVVVRYNRAGRYFYEPKRGTRKRLTLAEAVKFALLPGAKWHENRPGGMRFDAEVRKAKQAMNETLNPCPRCGHTTHDTHEVRSLPRPVFRPSYPNAPAFTTRAEAETYQCRWQAEVRKAKR